MSFFYHEQLHRSADTMKRLKDFPVTICGAGALGANMAESLARSGVARLRLIDNDRVEARNLSTQPFQRGDIGAFKATMMANMLFRAVGVQAEAVTKRLDAQTVGTVLPAQGVIVDAFDNSVGRGLVKAWCAEAGLPCLHVGLARDYAEVLWNDVYRVPSPAHDDVCDYPLARNLVMMTVAVACEVLITYIATGDRPNYTLTLNDFSVQPYA